GERLGPLVDARDEALARRGIELGLEAAGDRLEQRVVFRAGCDGAVALAAAQVDVDLSGAERIGARAAPVDAGEEVVVLVPRRDMALDEEAVVAEPRVHV